MSGIIDVGYKLGSSSRPKKIIFCVPVFPKPFKETCDSIEDEREVLAGAGWKSDVLWQVGCPYISAARALLLRTALDAQATAIIFVDQDVSWTPGTALKLLETEGGMVAGTYRYKQDGEEKYMGGLRESPQGRPIARPDGALDALHAPAGFLKVTREAVNLMMTKHPELCWGEASSPHFDLFAHGVMDGEWRGEDVAACMRWIAAGQKLWIVPDLDITHHSIDKAYSGNLHEFLQRTVVVDPNRYAAKRTSP
jgi:hypothetical protein